MRKAVILGLLILFVAFYAGCDALYVKYTATYLDAFDTVVFLSGYARQRSAFDRVSAIAHARLVELHRIYDGYHEYDGLNNLATVNREAGSRPVAVPAELIDLIAYCKRMQERYPGQVNIALGGVLTLWHECRERAMESPESAEFPSLDALRAAAEHADLGSVLIDADAGTISFADPALVLDLGAVAKGYAVEVLARELAASEMTSFLINAGGNVRAGAAPLDGRSAWVVGVEDPEFPGSDPLVTLSLLDASLVTSGDSHRYYAVDGVRYHHLIDPQTLFPARFARAVTVLTSSSADADFLSTALFIMPYSQGRTLVDSLDGVEALWVLPDGTIEMTGGFERAVIHE